MSQAKAVSKGVISVAAWNVAKIGSGALVAPVLARLLSTAGYGRYAYYLAIIFLAAPFANLGTSYLLTRYVAERPGDAGWRSNIAALAGLVNILGILLVGTIVSLFIFPRPGSGNDSIIIAVAVVGAIVFEQVWYFSRGILYGLKREELAALPAAASSILATVLGIGLAVAGLGLAGVLLGLFIANLVSGVLTIRFATRFLVWPPRTRLLRLLPVRAMVQFGLSSMLFSTLSLALYRASTILIRHLSTDSEAGLYASAAQLSEFVWVIPLAVELVMLQSTAQLWAENRVDEITAIISRLLRYTALGTAFLLVIVVVFADQILGLYFGPDFAGASLPLRILAPGVFGFSLARVIWPVIQARGNVLACVAIVSASTVANLVLNVLLIPGLNAAGAAIATSISYGSVVFAYVWVIKGFGVEPLQGLPGGKFLLLCALTLVAAAPGALLIPSSLIALLAGGGLAAGVYWIGALKLNLISVVEIQEIVDSLPRPLQTFSEKIFRALKPTLLRLEGGLYSGRGEAKP